MLTLILQIATILIAARLFGLLFRRMGQSQVVGEMAAGIVLGPSVFGALAPTVSAYVFPQASLAYLNVLSQVGLLLFMFLIGLEMDARLLRNAKRTALVVSNVSIAVPFVLGVVLALSMRDVVQADSDVHVAGYALFFGIAMSVTAFPVLARMLQEKRLTTTRLGTIALACAALNDVTAWCILAAVVVIARAGAIDSLTFTIAGSAIFIVVMAFVIRPLLRISFDRRERGKELSQDLVGFLLVFALASAWVTEWLGIHALFGAFMAGAILPAHYDAVKALIRRLEDITVVFLLPLFFAFTGLKTQIGLVNTPELWLLTALIIGVAVLGKFGGAAIAARATGMPWREAGALGALMNTRGLMELVVLNIGLEIGVISPTVFTMMVLMALVTTFMTAPLLTLFRVEQLQTTDR